MGVELDAEDAGREGRKTEVDEFHVFSTTQADGAHQGLEQETCIGVSGGQRTDQSTVEDSHVLQTTREFEIADLRVQVFQGVHDGRTRQGPPRISPQVGGRQCAFRSWVADRVSFIQDDAAPVEREDSGFRWNFGLGVVVHCKGTIARNDHVVLIEISRFLLALSMVD